MRRVVVRLHRDERGTGLVESLVSSALLGIALVVLIGSFSTLAIASNQAKRSALAQAAARAQAARIKAAPYQANGDYSSYYQALPTGMTRSLTVTWWDGSAGWAATQNANGLQKISLTITSAGAPITSLEFAKADR